MIPLGRVILICRVTAMAALLVWCLPFYYLWRLLGLRRFWPRVFLTGIGRIAGLRVTVTGKPRHNALLLANHVSWLDIPAIAGASGSAFVAHDGLAANPLLKQLCAMNDTVFIARHRRETVAQQVAEIRKALDDTGALTLFPEGTTGDGVSLLPFKSALLSAIEPIPPGVIVQPVLLAYDDPKSVAWRGAERGIDNFRRVVGQLQPIRLTVRFLEPLTGEALASRKTMAAAAQAAIEQAMQASALQFRSGIS